MTTITVLTWNLFWALGHPTSTPDTARRILQYARQRNDRTTITRIAAAITQLRPDIIGAQEIDGGSRRNGQFNQVDALGERLSLPHTAFAADRRWLRYCNDGNALLSRFSLTTIKEIVLPYRVERRVAIKGTVRLNNRPIDVYVTHFGAHSVNRKERQAQARALREEIRRSARSAIVMGDLNCGPDDEAYRILCAGGLLRGLAHTPTYPASRPTRIYDHILCTEGLKILECRTVDVKHSDHLAVFARIKVLR